jgi:hypothetical protein
MYFLLLIIVAAMVLSGQEEAREFQLAEQQWEHRVLIVFAPEAGDARYQQQKAVWNDNFDEMFDRDMLFVPVFAATDSHTKKGAVSENTRQTLRKRFNIGDDEFRVVLIGKDGGSKLRLERPASTSDLFPLIDSMPMRQREMRRGGSE